MQACSFSWGGALGHGAGELLLEMSESTIYAVSDSFTLKDSTTPEASSSSFMTAFLNPAGLGRLSLHPYVTAIPAEEETEITVGFVNA